MRIFARILAAIAIAAFAVGPVSAATATNASTYVAQAGTTGSLSGTALDETGAPVTGAAVVVRAGSTTYQTTTDAKGAFSIENIAPGLYTISVRKPGFDAAIQPDFAVFAGENDKVSVTMHTATLTSLRTIATVRTAGRGTFNTSTASVNTVSSQVFADQAQPQVTRVLNQIPGVQISLPQTSGNGAVPGAITFPNIRGALSNETATLIDGHPLSVGTYGDYVTTFLNSFMLSGADVIKGPGAMSPETNYAIGGTVNFRTKDPTLKPTPDYTIGVTNHGGTYSNFGISDTIDKGRLGFVADVASINEASAVHGYQANYAPSGGVANWNGASGTVLNYNDSQVGIPGTASANYSSYQLYACCYTVDGDYNSTSELLKARYKFSGSTTATVSYLGSQTFANQNGNTSSQIEGTFDPNGLGKSPSTPLLITAIHPGGTDQEINNEPILQAEVSTTLGNDTILARYYHASIDRLVFQGNANPLQPTVVTQNLFGNNYKNGVSTNFNGPTQVAFFDHYNQAEIDKLAGLSFEYDHPIGDDDITFAVDQTNSTTTSYSQGVNVNTVKNSDQFGNAQLANPSVALPTGSGQLFTTYLLRGRAVLGQKLTGTLSLYDNTYRNTYPVSCVGGYYKCSVDGSNVTFQTSNTSHFDERLGLEFRPRTNLAVRFSAGSAIAPPYLKLLSQVPSLSYNSNLGVATLTQINNDLQPETAFGYDLGASLGLNDHVTFVSADLYLTNLYNHFITSYAPSPYTCGSLPVGSSSCPGYAGANTPIFYAKSDNLNNARFEGFELSIKRTPEYGFGYELSGAMQRGYAYNLPTCFYAINKSAPNCASLYQTNLAIIPGQNFTGYAYGPPSKGQYAGLGYNGFSNQNIPYLQGNVEVNFHAKNGLYAAFGETLYGKNNSLNEPPFGVAYASVRYPVSKTIALQVSGDNIFNAYSGLFPLQGQGVAIPLANGTMGATQANVLGPATYRFVLTKALP